VPEKLLVFIPTYNERGNVDKICREVLGLALPCDILFMDDGSPDGTGELLDRLAAEHPQVHVIHRPAKLGIGSAHKEGIAYAYAQGYEQLVTMDCDFTHNPGDIPRMLAVAAGCNVVVGSRYKEAGSLPAWNPLRKFLTNLGHLLTTRLLGIPGDASGALRLYNLTKIDPNVFTYVRSMSYSFFFESLLILTRNGYTIHEIPIVLPARTYGHSKMTALDALRSGRFLLQLWLQDKADPARFRVPRRNAPVNASLDDPQDWDAYWNAHGGTTKLVYAAIASTYRNLVIKRNLEHFLRKNFTTGSRLLHAGCGSGQVDMSLHKDMHITAVDISTEALNIYLRNNPDAYQLKHASIFDLPTDSESFDGVYNLGVVEHFTHDEIKDMLREFHRVLRPDGKVVIFWPHRRATSVLVLGLAHRLLNDVLKKDTRLHPPEISLTRGKVEAKKILEDAGFRLRDYHFGARDLFVQAVVIGQKVG
jgi:dolichol-phosphate mannosyltransferase